MEQMEAPMGEVLQELHNILKIVGVPIISFVGSLIGVWLGWRLSSHSQRLQRRLDSLDGRFAALSKVMTVVDNVPPDLGRGELAAMLESNEDFRNNLAGRLVRLFGLRTELLASLDREIVGFIDTTFRPLFVIGAGSYDLRPDKLDEFSTAVSELRGLVSRVEQRLITEHDRLTK